MNKAFMLYHTVIEHLSSCHESIIHMFYAKDQIDLDNPSHNNYKFWDTSNIVSYKTQTKLCSLQY